MHEKNDHILALNVHELAKTYGNTKAVDHISFEVKQGTIFGLLGPNGAGKSTTIKMLTTLLPPTSGKAEIYGIDIVKNPDKVRQIIGYVSQLISADGDLTGYENLLISAKLYGLEKSVREPRIKEVLDFMNLSQVAHKMVKEYSGGMIRRLEIAQGLIHRPKVLFLDEPSVGLDPSARLVVWRHLKEWRDRFNTTICMTTHDMVEADKLCDIVAFMYFGKIVAINTPIELKAEIGKNATLDDVFLHHTGASITNATTKDGGEYELTKQVRGTISHLD